MEKVYRLLFGGSLYKLWEQRSGMASKEGVGLYCENSVCLSGSSFIEREWSMQKWGEGMRDLENKRSWFSIVTGGK